ncbi:hypothetical protein [Cohnella zeiphila]|uniref:Uncharacterized protein n=1 Tax=Cohnella zeiphila TaxID=2761120 RepID=A0A7X0SLV2_9BACL|nr:hypothetical protein [Cohnella zeiphila]MBB6732266.1 hypothetical protein [Cohnella zeiphila]
MLAELLGIIAVYALAVLYAHWVASHRSKAEASRYVLVAGNHQAQIEGYLRSMQAYSRRSGTDLAITVLLRNSSDETQPIVEKFARHSSDVEWRREEAEAEPEAARAEGFRIDLSLGAIRRFRGRRGV